MVVSSQSSVFKTFLVILVVLLLASCKPEDRRTLETQTGAQASYVQVPTRPMSALPTPTLNSADIEPTLPPSPTLPPVPTPLPTPVVTPIPVASPPFIPEVVGKAQQPFWIYYWQGNEVWRVDDQGKNHELLLDTHKRLGLYLTANPYLESLVDTKEQSRVKVAPDGKKLALVVVDKPGLVRKGESATFSIYLFDTQTGDLKFLSEGASLEWAPDSKRIAFVQDVSSNGTILNGGLWIINLETDQIYQAVKEEPTNPALRVSYWAWSPDSRQIAYRYSEGMIDQPEIWIKNAADSEQPHLVPSIPSDIFYNFSWMPDGQHLLWSVRDHAMLYPRPVNLWAVSVKTGEQKQLTQYLSPSELQWSLDGKWLVLSAEYHYGEEESLYDTWLLSADGYKLLRLTSAKAQDAHDSGYLGGYWSPDGTRLLLSREGIGLEIMSLQTGEVTPLDVNLLDLSRYNYAVGGNK